jgi:anti-anti-sigma factor
MAVYYTHTLKQLENKKMITTMHKDKAFTIQVTGDFKFHLHKEMRAIREHVASQHFNTVVVDLTKSDYVDSSALGMLLLLKDSVSKFCNITIKLGNSQHVYETLKVANFDKIFTLTGCIIEK